MQTKFILKGTRPFLRTDYEISSLYKDESDRAFKMYKKQYLDPLLKAKGFLQYVTKYVTLLSSSPPKSLTKRSVRDYW